MGKREKSQADSTLSARPNKGLYRTAQDHDPSYNQQMLNGLSHPGPLIFLFLMVNLKREGGRGEKGATDRFLETR